MMLAEAVRAACREAARDGYRDAAISGLCGEGAQEAALGAIDMLDVARVVRQVAASASGAQR